jgi:hypothetical protein
MHRQYGLTMPPFTYPACVTVPVIFQKSSGKGSNFNQKKCYTVLFEVLIICNNHILHYFKFFFVKKFGNFQFIFKVWCSLHFLPCNKILDFPQILLGVWNIVYYEERKSYTFLSFVLTGYFLDPSVKNLWRRLKTFKERQVKSVRGNEKWDIETRRQFYIKS